GSGAPPAGSPPALPSARAASLLPRQAEPALRDDGALDLVGAATEALHRRGGVEPLEAAGERRRRVVGRELAGEPEDLHADRGVRRTKPISSSSMRRIIPTEPIMMRSKSSAIMA